jgi:hypothetical protein
MIHHDEHITIFITFQGIYIWNFWKNLIRKQHSQAHITTPPQIECFKTGRFSDTDTYINVVSDSLDEWGS